MMGVNLSDARIDGISSQGRFEFAYNAARLTATLVIRACGYRVISKNGYHYITFQALQAADSTFGTVAIYFDRARDRRNEFSYDSPVLISDADADDLLRTVEQFRSAAETWVRTRHPELTDNTGRD